MRSTLCKASVLALGLTTVFGLSGCGGGLSEGGPGADTELTAAQQQVHQDMMADEEAAAKEARSGQGP